MFESTLNQQINMNEQMNNRFNEISDKINLIQQNIENFLISSDSRIQSLETKFTYLQYANKISFIIDTLKTHLDEISESIILAKLGLISKHILHSDELDHIRQHFK